MAMTFDDKQKGVIDKVPKVILPFTTSQRVNTPLPLAKTRQEARYVCAPY